MNNCTGPKTYINTENVYCPLDHFKDLEMPITIECDCCLGTGFLDGDICELCSGEGWYPENPCEICSAYEGGA